MTNHEIVLLEHNHNIASDLAQKAGDAISAASEFIDQVQQGFNGRYYKLDDPVVKGRLVERLAASIVAEREGRVTVVSDRVSGGDFLCLGCHLFGLNFFEDGSCGRKKVIDVNTLANEFIIARPTPK
jgi:hypothetical protein